MTKKKSHSLIDVSEKTGLHHTRIVTWIERDWISPPETESFDEEDIRGAQVLEQTDMENNKFRYVL